MSMKILLVEDEPKVASFIKQGLEEQQYDVTVAFDGFFGKKLAVQNPYDLIILDVLIPQINGIEVCKQIRAENISTPVLMLTALGTTDDKVLGLDSGADDYLVKPFDFKELLARVRVLTKRYVDKVYQSSKIQVADLEMNMDEKTVRRHGKKIDLTAKEFALLEYFVRHKGKVLSRTEIAEKVWDLNFDTGTNVIDVYVNFLRKKIDKDFDVKLIHTVVGMGYIMKVEEEEEA